MAHQNIRTVPKTNDILAAFQFGADALSPCPGHEDGTGHSQSADETLAAWQTAQAFPEATLLLMKSPDRLSIGARNGGMIIEGRSKMNVGLVVASTRKLPPVDLPANVPQPLVSEDRFRCAFWTVLSRLQGCRLPRALAFDLAGVTGHIQVENGSLYFSGDFLSPEDFVAELRAACAIEDELKFSLADLTPEHKGPAYSTSDLLSQVIGTSASGQFEYDAEGWPLGIAEGATFDVVQTLSALSRSLHSRDGGTKSTTLAILTAANKPIVTGLFANDGSVCFKVA